MTYHKYDDNGNSQVYNARWELGAWKIAQATQWTTRWSFQGGGSIPFDVRVSGVKSDGGGGLTQSWSHWELGRERWQLNPETMTAEKKLDLPPNRLPSNFGQLESEFPGMAVRRASDLGKSPEPGTFYVLRWETLGPNRDRPRTPPLPEPTSLKLYKIRG